MLFFYKLCVFNKKIVKIYILIYVKLFYILGQRYRKNATYD